MNTLIYFKIGITIGWVFLCAAVFMKFEKDWDYFKSFYFFFCSLTTIGYGKLFVPVISLIINFIQHYLLNFATALLRILKIPQNPCFFFFHPCL